MAKLKIQAIAFDVDGTLYDYHDKRVHQSTIDAIHAAKAQGVCIILATARSFAELNSVCQQEVKADYFIGASGHSIIDSRQRSIYAEHFTWDQTERMIRIAAQYDAGLTLKYDFVNCLYSHFDDMQGIYSNIGESIAPTIKCEAKDYHAKELPIGFSIRGENGIRDRMAATLAQYPYDYRLELFRNVIVADVFLPCVSKLTALDYLCGRLGIAPETVMTFGDSTNDIEMTRWAGIGVAMGNGRDELKRQAKYVCETGWEDGIAKTIAKYVL